MVKFPSIGGKPSFEITKSYFVSGLDEESFETFRRNLAEGKSLVNGGFLKIASTEGSVSGNPFCAWDTGVIMTDYLNLRHPISNPFSVQLEPIGRPRNSFADYFSEFSYQILEPRGERSPVPTKDNPPELFTSR